MKINNDNITITDVIHFLIQVPICIIGFVAFFVYQGIVSGWLMGKFLLTEGSY